GNRPAAPRRRPEPNQAAASTRRTGTPRVAVISRSLARARIAVPSFVTRRKTVTAAVTANASAIAMIWVRFTFVPNTSYVWVELGSGRNRANGPPTGARQ